MTAPGPGAEGGIIVPLSALEHFSYCPRQCALIHVEQTFDENVFTVRGRLAHERVDAAPGSTVRGVRSVRSLPLWSDRHGLSGRADAVEFHDGVPLPVEYKLGRLVGGHAALQLCGQALCLEEMFGCPVPRGALYSHATRRRDTIAIDEELRARTFEAIAGVRGLLSREDLPPAPNDRRCVHCSLINACLPSVVGESARVRGYQGALFRPVAAEEVDWPGD